MEGQPKADESNQPTQETTQDTSKGENQPNEDNMVVGPDGTLMTKNAYKKLMKKLEKEKRKEETKKRVEQENKKAKKNQEEEELEEYVKDPNDPCADKFGDWELIRSAGDPEERFQHKYTRLKNLDESLKDQEVTVRGRVHRITGKGSACFIVLRENFSTCQACIFVEEGTSKGMVDYSRRIPRESLVQIKGLVHMPDAPIKKCTQQVELLIKEIWTLHKSVPRLPFNLDDAGNIVENQMDEDDAKKEEEDKKDEKGKKKTIIVGQNTRLDNRIMDLRVPANQAIMRISAGICRFFREFLQDRDFVEIHSPKLIGGTSEGGAEVFRLDYFGSPACLAQSPQLYKQMGVVCDLERVFEIGPVFRAEDSNTPRHLCEFTGLDLEMSFNDHYFEVVDLLCELFEYIFENLNKKFEKEINVVREQYPFKDFVFKKPVPRLEFVEACELLKEHGYTQNPAKDLETVNEKALGEIVKNKYETDFFLVYNYPRDARPFYSMLNPKDENYTNSYDFFMRGEEILSGAQRVHDPDTLRERAIEKGIAPETIKDYIECFKYGSYAHGGGGIGLERVLKLFLGIHNIRKCSMFPRDPKRLFP